jgi:hypothetical protein
MEGSKRFFLRAHDTYVKRSSVSALPNVVSFLRGLQFFLAGNINRFGWDYSPNDTSTIAVLFA